MAARDDVISEIELRLGGQMVDVELDPEHYHLAIDKALERFRQRSENAVEESLMTLPLLADVNVYTLPNEVIEIKDIYRRGGGSTGISTSGGIEPFGAAFMNSHVLGSGMAGGGGSGGLATFDFFAQKQELMDRLFGNEIIFTWNHLLRMPRSAQSASLRPNKAGIAYEMQSQRSNPVPPVFLLAAAIACSPGDGRHTPGAVAGT